MNRYGIGIYSVLGIAIHILNYPRTTVRNSIENRTVIINPDADAYQAMIFIIFMIYRS